MGTAPGVPWVAWRVPCDPRPSEDALARAEAPTVTAVPRRAPAGSSQQYLGQEEYYGGEQYSHGQAASEPLSQQYYPDGEAARARARGFGPLLPSPAEYPLSPVPERDGAGQGRAGQRSERQRRPHPVASVGAWSLFPRGSGVRPDVLSEQTVRLL